MTVMPRPAPDRTRRRAVRALLALTAAGLALLASGCSTAHPAPISATELADAQTFPYYPLYWVGRSFDGHPLAAADGLEGYIPSVGDSVYYGDCVQSKGIFGGGSCELPLQVTSVIYRLHSNATLGAQSNLLVRGVPATSYDEGRSIEIYSGRLAIDVFSDTFAHALKAANELLPLNAPGSATGRLPAPVYCPGLSGPVGRRLAHVLATLPRQPCQKAAAEVAFTNTLSG
jgi:hypothetical protein